MEDIIGQAIAMFIAFTIFCVPPIILIGYLIWSYFYYKSEEFIKIRDSIQANTEKCNELNAHIEGLKNAYINIRRTDYGASEYNDTSRWNYKRPEMRNISFANNIHNCSKSVLANAKIRPFEYICKYFNIKPTEENLSEFESILNDFSAAEQGKELLIKERSEILNSIEGQIPFIVRTFDKERLMRRLGFDKVSFSQPYYPRYIFSYVSPGGNASENSQTIMDIPMLNRFIEYLSGIIKYKKSAAGQRALMTSALREEIKERDHYTCQKCGNSTKKEPNLLLEIDHIKPLSKGGQTTLKNLQTLCWKCNRTKGAKYNEESN